MKSFNKRNPEYLQLQRRLQTQAQTWLDLSPDEQEELCLKYLLLPVIKRQKPITETMRQALLNSVQEIREQSLKFLAESPNQFTSVYELLDLSARILLMSDNELEIASDPDQD